MQGEVKAVVTQLLAAVGTLGIDEVHSEVSYFMEAQEDPSTVLGTIGRRMAKVKYLLPPKGDG